VLKPWDIFSKNGQAIKDDYELVTKGRKSQPLSATNQVLGDQVFVEEGAKVECAILNSTTGPIYIGKDAEIMEGSVVRGPLAMCDHSVLKLSTKIYGPTTVGPYSKVGGEVNNSVIFACSNKGHDGFLGNSVLGEWCNIGADSNNSNLKNNYAEVKLWNYTQERFVNTGLQFCGLIMGDHSKCGINTMFNTGTVVGVNANIFGSGFPRNFVPSFSWGGAAGFTTYKLRDAFDVAARVFERRGMVFNEMEQEILTKVFELTEKYRK
jgi:UDP-N-acetylglucosamine diphosphorylase/glucosamine-1-phosphate N-acetyltransferase